MSRTIHIKNGFILMNAIHGVLHSSTSRNEPDAVLLLASGAQIETGRPFSEVMHEVLRSMHHDTENPQVSDTKADDNPPLECGEPNW